ncbi:MAG: endolytic transglycosylase MltG, partial [Bacteriovoracia bacterium]
MKKLFLFIVIAPILSFILIAIHVWFLLDSPYEGKKLSFTINKGEGFSSINYRLKEAGIIDNPRLFHHYTKYHEALNKFKAGKYAIEPGITMPQLMDTFVNGIPIMTSITIPEGKNIFEIADILKNHNIAEAKNFIKLAKDPEFMKELGIPAKKVEGYLYPDTYKFVPNTSAREIIETMVAVFKDKTKDLLFKHPKLSKHELIILASMVEKETGAGFERPIIA